MKTIDVVAAVIRVGNRVLATQRGYGEWRGSWEFPGGKTEPGESPSQALVREIREELCLHIHVGRLLRTIEYDYPTFHLTMHCFISSIVEGEIELVEHEAMRWLTPNALDEVDWLPADVEVVQELTKFLSELRQKPEK